MTNWVEPYPTPPPDAFVDIDALEMLTCGHRADGTAACWAPSQLTAETSVEPPEGVAFEQISVGSRHACGLTGDGEILCWGYDWNEGELTPPE